MLTYARAGACIHTHTHLQANALYCHQAAKVARNVGACEAAGDTTLTLMQCFKVVDGFGIFAFEKK